MRSFRRSPKHLLVATCLLLVLAAGVTTQIAAQCNMSLDLTVIVLPPQYLLFDAWVNGVEYCILTELGTGSSLPSTFQLKGATVEGLTLELVLNGEVYEGPCPEPISAGGVSNYLGAGNGGFVGPFTGTITLDSSGGLPEDFTIVIVFTVGDGGLHSESKITGTLSELGETGCMLENMASQYAFVTGVGFNVNLQLLTHEGACSIEINEEIVFELPTLAFTCAAPVGGVVTPVNALALFAPWLAVIGVVGCIGTVVVVARKRRQ